jgi:hypothetical protein
MARQTLGSICSSRSSVQLQSWTLPIQSAISSSPALARRGNLSGTLAEGRRKPGVTACRRVRKFASNRYWSLRGHERDFGSPP